MDDPPGAVRDLTPAVSPKREFGDYLEVLRARLGREHRTASYSEWHGLKHRHDAMVRWALDDTPNPPGLVGVRTIPRRWDWGLIEVEFGPEPLELVPSAGAEMTDKLQRRDPIPVPLVTEVVRLREVDGKSWPVIEDEVELSHRKVDYIRQALKHGDLDWDLHRGCIALGRYTENINGGVRLPIR